jgi:hypothetical protein
MNEHLASYYYDSNDSGQQVFDIYACYDNVDQYDIRDVQFYDVYNKDGVCVNEGNPFYEFPSWCDIYKLYLVK